MLVHVECAELYSASALGSAMLLKEEIKLSDAALRVDLAVADSLFVASGADSPDIYPQSQAVNG